MENNATQKPDTGVMKKKLEATDEKLSNFEKKIINLLHLTTDLAGLSNKLENNGSTVNKIIARAKNSNTFENDGNILLQNKKIIVEAFTSARKKLPDLSRFPELLGSLQQKRDTAYELYKSYSVNPPIHIKHFSDIITDITDINNEVDDNIKILDASLIEINNSTELFTNFSNSIADLNDKMSGKTRELSIEEITANIIKILLETPAKDLTNRLIGDAVLNGITSRYTLEEVANGESMKDTTSNFSNEKGKFCGEHTDGGREVAGQVCVEVITQCLTEKNPIDCLKKWNGTDWSHGIEFSNVYKPVAEKLARHLGLHEKTTDQLVKEFNSNIDEYNNKNKNKKYTLKHLGDGIIKALHALEKTVKPVPDANKTTTKVAYVLMPNNNNNVFQLRSMLGGSNKNNSSDIAISYANFIRNTHALKNMVSMTGGGGNTEINENTIQVIRKTWTELATLMKSKGSSFSDNANKSFLSDVDSLERSFRRTKIITKYLEIVKQVFTDGSFIKYLSDIGVKHTDIELSIVQKLVEKYNTSIKAGEKKLGKITNTFSASANSVDLTEITKSIVESMKTMKESFEKKIDENHKNIKTQIDSLQKPFRPSMDIEMTNFQPQQDGDNTSQIPTVPNSGFNRFTY